MSLLTPDIASWVGREATFTAPEPYSGAEFRYFALAIGDENPRWRAGEAPPTFVVESNQYLDDRDALLRGGEVWQLVVPGARALRGGHEYTFHRPVRAGDRITVTWRIVDVNEKTSSSGRSLLFVVSEAVYRDAAGEAVAENRETVVYEELP